MAEPSDAAPATEPAAGRAGPAAARAGPAAGRAEPQGGRRRARLDPRSKILLVVIVSLAVMSPDGLRFVPAALVLGVALALSEGAWKRALALVAAGAAMGLGGWLAPLRWPHPVTLVIALACQFTIRFVATVGVAADLVTTTSPTGLNSALRAARTPRAIAVTLAVMLRFFPVVAGEAAAVLDAMRLGGLAGAGGLARHPIRALERFAVPMIAASLRASDDLSAAALVRGLGSRRRPTAMNPPRFAVPDLACGLIVVVLATLSLVAPGAP
ncbi:MAG: energy-coupling factor transporter transmembrane protein EcfT [Bifidobacteriaceae bacterium]|nr:energy-coupling factor transporter transmembrane protein EcfT [Bifidobacteriaceae bacterium]